MIQIRSLNLEKFDKSKHYLLMSSLGRDNKVKGYVSRRFEEFVKSPIGDDFELGKTYVAIIDGNEVGLVGTFDLDGRGHVEIWAAIDSSFRNHGYGGKILGLLTPYLIENIDGLEDVKLKIAYDNIASNKVAIENGFTLVDRDSLNKKNTYLYFGKSR